jgi:hypothetical protein
MKFYVIKIEEQFVTGIDRKGEACLSVWNEYALLFRDVSVANAYAADIIGDKIKYIVEG